MIKEVYTYTLNETVRRESSSLSWFLVAPISEFLTKEGLTVKCPAFLKGKSGANHSFDIIAYKGSTDVPQRTVVIDLATSAEDAVSEQPVIALFAKIFDVSPEKAYLIAIPKLTENGKKMAELYKIQTIEAGNAKEATALLKASIKK